MGAYAEVVVRIQDDPGARKLVVRMPPESTIQPEDEVWVHLPPNQVHIMSV